MERFTRTRLLVGDRCFKSLQSSHVAVIGLGAVGGYVVEGLARAGIGRLSLVDFDEIQRSNINRQILALESTIGTSKAHAAKNRVLDINPQCQIHAYEVFADFESISAIIESKPDILIDAIDSLNPKVQVLTASCQAGVTTFSSMGAALRTDPGRIRIGDISETKNCPLARRLRKRLRSNSIYSGITCVYSTEPVTFDYQPPPLNDNTCMPLGDRGRTRRTLGSLPTLTGIFGLTLANEVIMHVTRIKSTNC